MKTRYLHAIVFLVGLSASVLASAQQDSQDSVENWPAPATWSPPRSHAGLTMMGEVTNPLPFIGVSPCRILDTRGNGAPIQGGIFTGGSDVRSYVLAGICGIPASARAVSLNFTVTGPGQTTAGFLTAWPTGGAVPPVSILNWDHVPAQVANAAVVPTSASVSITVNVSAPTHVIMDVNGFYAGAGTGSFNTFLGLNAGNFTMTGDSNTAVGYRALLSNTSGSSNTAIGRDALPVNTQGSNNTALGWNSLSGNVTGGFNTAIGSGALLNSDNSSNTAIGNNTLGAATGSSNIALGNGAGSLLTTGNSNIYIGNAGASSESSTIRIGSTQTATYIKGISGVSLASGGPVYIDSNGQLGTIVPTSSRRYKEDIRDIEERSDGLMRLRPVAFNYRREFDPEGLPQYGLIAEEVAEVYPELIACDRDGRPDSVRYHLVNALLLNEVQKQHRTNEAQERHIEEQGRLIEDLRARLARLEALVSLK